MRAFILAGGLGTRLRPVVSSVPKPLAPLGGKAFLEYQLHWLKNNGLREIVFCTGYLGEMIETHFGNGAAHGLRLYYSREESPLGTGGALKNAAPYVDGTFLAVNGDTLINLELSALISFHRQKGGLATLVLAPAVYPGAYGRIITDREARVVALQGKTGTGDAREPVNAGVYLLEPGILNYIPAARKVSLEEEVFPHLAEKRALFVLVVNTGFLDIGTPETYRLAQQAIKKDQEEGY